MSHQVAVSIGYRYGDPMDRFHDTAALRYYREFCHCLPKIGARALAGIAILLLMGPSLVAQGGVYIPLDDPDLPLFEHLVTRGVVSDPSPSVRPFTRGAARTVLVAATPSGAVDRALIERLRGRWGFNPDSAGYQVQFDLGAQGYGAARRNPMQPEGKSRGAEPYAQIAGAVSYGPFVAATRVIGENRIKHDPDWPGSADQDQKSLAFRAGEAYAGLRFGQFGLEVGSLDRNWGPAGFAGLGVSNVGYPRPGIAMHLNTAPVGAAFLFTPLPSVVTDAGLVQRYYAGHRLTIRPTANLDLTVWETIILADEADQGTDVVGTLVGVMSFASQFGRKANTNAILGVEGRWRIRPGLQLEGQFAADDIRLGSDNTGAGEAPRPDRWAIAIGARGALGSMMSWLARYERVSTLAYRTAVPEENFMAEGIGLVRTIPDNDEVTLAVGIPVMSQFLVTPMLKFQRQGEGRLQNPVDFSPETPTFLLGTVRRTFRAAIALTGRVGWFTIQGDIGINRLSNADHQPGRTRTDPEGRILITAGFGHHGVIR
jgi:hypothetical protein